MVCPQSPFGCSANKQFLNSLSVLKYASESSEASPNPSGGGASDPAGLIFLFIKVAAYW